MTRHGDFQLSGGLGNHVEDEVVAVCRTVVVFPKIDLVVLHDAHRYVVGGILRVGHPADTDGELSVLVGDGGRRCADGEIDRLAGPDRQLWVAEKVVFANVLIITNIIIRRNSLVMYYS